MGNHDVGRAMSRMADLLEARRKPEDTALALLDEMAEDYRGADAEFDDALHEDTALRRLVTEAFIPRGATVERYSPGNDPYGDLWYQEIGRSFSERYGFC